MDLDAKHLVTKRVQYKRQLSIALHTKGFYIRNDNTQISESMNAYTKNFRNLNLDIIKKIKRSEVVVEKNDTTN